LFWGFWHSGLHGNLRYPNGFLDIVSSASNMQVEKGCQLAYLGKPLDFEHLLGLSKNENHSND